MAFGKSKKSNKSAPADPSGLADSSGSSDRSGGSTPLPAQRPDSIEVFECVRCGCCCTGAGFVNLEPDECPRIAAFLGLTLQEFLDKYTRYQAGYERWLVDGEGPDEPCVFLQRDTDGLAGCRIQGDAKPVQCSTFPMKWRIPGFETWCGAFQKGKSE